MTKLGYHILIRRRLRTLAVSAIAMLAIILPLSAKAQINAERVMAIGANAMYFEDYLVAIQYFNQAIGAKPYLAKPYFLRSIAKLNLEDFHGAEDDASKAIELNEFITDAWEVRGVARQNMGNFRGAADDYRHALELLPKNRQMLFNMAAALTELKEFGEADSIYTRLIELYPGFENAYIGRARLGLLKGDTISAIKDINITLEKDSNSFNGHVMRAELQLKRRRPDFKAALVDMDHAIRLEPRVAGLYVNRAFIRYSLRDWYGAMDDYDYALTLEPDNQMALFNRGLLNAEVEANDRALSDFSAVLDMNPDDHRALYNRAMILAKKHDYDGAIRDAGKIIGMFPDFPTGYQLRSQFYFMKGDKARAATDYDRAESLSRKLKPIDGVVESGRPDTTDDAPDIETLTKREFASLLTVDDNTDMRQEYNNTAIRGKVQDRNINITPEGIVELSFYNSPTEIKSNTYYIKEVDDLNATRQLRFVVLVTVNPPVLSDDADIARHFKSIEYYNSYLATHTPRAIDYVGRAMDFITLRDYRSAIADLDRAITLMPGYSPAYLLRAQARLRLKDAGPQPDGDHHLDAMAARSFENQNTDLVLADLDKAISLSNSNPFAIYNKGVVLLGLGRTEEALDLFNTAISLKPDFGEAYFNRGYTFLRQGRRNEGLNDLSRAGELGVISAYNLMKRISRQ